MAFMSKHIVHLSQRLIYQLKHLMNVFTLLGSKLLLVFTLRLMVRARLKQLSPILSISEISRNIARIFALSIITQMSIAHLIKILGNLNLHIIRNTPHTSQYAHRALSKVLNPEFPATLSPYQTYDGYARRNCRFPAVPRRLKVLRCLHDASLDKAQTEIHPPYLP